MADSMLGGGLRLADVVFAEERGKLWFACFAIAGGEVLYTGDWPRAAKPVWEAPARQKLLPGCRDHSAGGTRV